MYLVLEEKRRDIVFGFMWCVVRKTWFKISCRYLVFFLYLTLKNEEKRRGMSSRYPVCFILYLTLQKDEVQSAILIFSQRRGT